MRTCVFTNGECECKVPPPKGVNLATFLRECKLAPPYNPPPPTIGLGDKVGWLLSKLGIKKKSGCGCYKRQIALNRWGDSVYSTYLGLWNGWFPRTAKSLRRKRLAKAEKAFQLSHPERLAQLLAAKELRRQKLVDEQKH